MRYSWNGPLNVNVWLNLLAILTPSSLGGEWQRDGRGAREWLRKLARRLRTTSPIDTGSPARLGTPLEQNAPPAQSVAPEAKVFGATAVSASPRTIRKPPPSLVYGCRSVALTDQSGRNHSHVACTTIIAPTSSPRTPDAGGRTKMKWRLIAATFAAAVLVGPTQAQEDPGSGN